MKNLVYTIISVLILSLFTLGKVQAFSYYSVSTQKFDTTLLADIEKTYATPQKILITQIGTKSKELEKKTTEWVNSLYYYSITRLKLPDLPYTYLLDENGIIYQGNSGIQGVNTGIAEAGGSIIIGYLSNNSSLTKRAETSLYTMVDELSSTWGISEIQTIKLKITKNENSVSTLSYETTDGDLNTSINDLFRNWKPAEKVERKYIAKIENLEYTPEIEVGKRTTVKLDIKNMNDFPWFTDSDPIYISVANNKESAFAVNQVWESFSKPISISDKTILPNQSVHIEFDMEAKVKVGQIKETFVVFQKSEAPFQDSSFEISLNVVKGDKTLVEVVSPQYGFVNIRDCKGQGCKIIDTLKEGEVFILVAEEDGWSKIQYGQEVEGWVVSRFLKKI